MNKKFNKIFATILIALMVIGLFPGSAFATYSGETDYGKSIMGQDYNNTRQFFATGTAGQAIPTAGLFPIAGSDGTYSRAIATDSSGNLQVDVLTITGADYAGTDNTTGPSKAVSIAGTDSSGYLQEIAVDSSGNLQADILALPAGNLGMQAMAASLSVVPASDITDATYIGDIKFGESLPAGTNNIGDVDIASALPAGSNQLGSVSISGANFGVPDGSSTAPGQAVAVAGFDSTNFQYLATDSDGQLQIDILTLPSVEVSGSCFGTNQGSTDNPDKVNVISGKTAGGNYVVPRVDSNGIVSVSTGTAVTAGTSTAPTYHDALAATDNGGTYRAFLADTDGRQQTANLTFADSTSVVSNIATTDETTMVAAPAGGSHIMPISIVLSAPAATEFTIRNGVAGTIIGRYYVQSTGQSCIVLGPEQLSHCSDASALTVQGTAQPYDCVVKYQVLTP